MDGKRRVWNFYAGPATLHPTVLEKAKRGLEDFDHTGMSILEISHRSKEYDLLQHETEAKLLKLLALDDNYRVLFLQGGASTQFAMVPMNFLTPNSKADYILTGVWSQKAYDEAVRFGEVHLAATTKGENYCRIPTAKEITLSDNPVYVHLTSNNTIYGSQWQSFPDCGDLPMVGDMSSDILSKKLDLRKFGLIYAGAQKNLGPAGVTIVIIRKDFLAKANTDLPTMLKYETHAEKDSLYNTPPTFCIYVLSLVLDWVEETGGVEVIEKLNREKAGLIYNEIDESGGYYKGHAEKDSRSIMNITFRLPTEELEKKFSAEATAKGLIGLKGHRSVGGLRASVYNAMSIDGCKDLALFMRDFKKSNG